MNASVREFITERLQLGLRFLDPILEALDNPYSFARFWVQLGYDAEPLLNADLSIIITRVDELLIELHSLLESIANDQIDDLDILSQEIFAMYDDQLLSTFADFSINVAEYLFPSSTVNEIIEVLVPTMVEDVLLHLMIVFLSRESPVALKLGILLDVFYLETSPAIVRGDEENPLLLRHAVERYNIDYKLIVTAIETILELFLPTSMDTLTPTAYVQQVVRNLARRANTFLGSVTNDQLQDAFISISIDGIALSGPNLQNPPQVITLPLRSIDLPDGRTAETELNFQPSAGENLPPTYQLKWQIPADSNVSTFDVGPIEVSLIGADLASPQGAGIRVGMVNDLPEFGIAGGVRLRFPENWISMTNGDPLVVTARAELFFAAPHTATIRFNQFIFGGDDEALAFIVPGLDGFGVVVKQFESAQITVGVGPATGEEFQLELAIRHFSLRLPRTYLVAVTKGLKIDDVALRRLRQTQLNDEILEALKNWELFNQVITEDQLTGFIEGIPSIQTDDERSSIKVQILAYVVNWVPELDDSEQLVSRDLVVAVPDDASPFLLCINSDGEIELDGDIPLLSLEPVMLGSNDSNIVVEAHDVQFKLNTPNKGLAFTSAALYLPPDLPTAPDLTITDCFIGQRGFSGTVEADWVLNDIPDSSGKVIDFDGELKGELAGFEGGVGHIAITFAENWPIASNIQGKMKLPSFQGVLDVQIQLQNLGEFTFTLIGAGTTGIELTQEELIRLNLRRLMIKYDAQETRAEAIISGGLEPLLMASDGLEWPRLDVTDLSIEQNLSDLTEPPILKIKEAWLDLKDLVTLDLWGFHFELNRIGIGYEEAVDKLWLDLTGSLKLIDQLPVGLGVEGFRITWPRTLHEDVLRELNVDRL